MFYNNFMINFRQIKNVVLMIIFSTLLGLLLLSFSFSLNSNEIEKNLTNSIQVLNSEGLYPEKIPGNKATRLDNWTDSLIINNSTFESHNLNLLERIVSIPRIEDNINPISTLDKYYLQGDHELHIETYSRYWHGYIVFLRPMLLFMSYTAIRKVCSLVHIILLVSFLLIAWKKINLKFSIAFLISYICAYNFVLLYSLQYSTIAIITLITGIIQMLFSEWLNSKDYYRYYFLIIGIITVYFDFLTCPLVTLGVNLVIDILLNSKRDLPNFAKLILYWGIGYAGFWAMKWIISFLVLGKEQFSIVLNTIKYRLSGTQLNGDKAGRIETLLLNLKLILNQFTIMISSLYILIDAYIRSKRVSSRKFYADKKMIIKLLICFVMPIIWILALTNHSNVHYYFTYRILIISLLAILTLPQCFYN